MEPKHTITLKEVTVITKPYTGIRGMLCKVYRITVLSAVILLIAGSLFLRENLYLELSPYTRVALFAAIAFLWKCKGKNHDLITPVIFQFYDDRLVIFREKKYYFNHYRKGWVTIKYDAIKYVKYNVDLRRLTIRGNIHFLWYKYAKDDEILAEVPFYNRFVCDTSEFTCLWYEDQHDIVKELEANVPNLKVLIHNSSVQPSKAV